MWLSILSNFRPLMNLHNSRGYGLRHFVLRSFPHLLEHHQDPNSKLLSQLCCGDITVTATTLPFNLSGRITYSL
ncbi:hypothetical protein CPB83DRAFT_865433 [Crepidotus variabilis]|uniref:Uncharacterized protein n=1 Tax=Crepidotus variabilis TaxID=179855 RepID=A0A9P6JHV9_9AGAR|nr:hypothetical protein CPB83DRAFT_865433 [Crepidotus variabilis]